MLFTRFGQSGQREDLDEAISLHREALGLRAAPHPDRSRSLNNLAICAFTRFGQSGQREDLDEAISLHREALGLLPAPHPDRSSSLNNLAIVLSTRFGQSGQREDLDEAISLHREALGLRAAPHPDRSDSLNNLAIVLSTRFNQSGQHEDLDDAINAHEQSLHALVGGHPSTCGMSTNLAKTLSDAYLHTHQLTYLDKAIAAFRVAVNCESAPASERFHAAKLWVRKADPDHESALEAYRAAIQLLPRLAMHGLDLHSRHKALTSGSDGLSRGAAACAIRSGLYHEAVELLEEGRAVFWSQALQLRTPMDDLRTVAPHLEQELKRLSFELEQGSLRDVSRNLSDTSKNGMSPEQEAVHFRRLNDKWIAAVEEVRKLDGFQDFLRPRRLSALQAATTTAPVVVLNASETGCAALILTPSTVQHVPLPEMTFSVANALVALTRQVVASRDGNVLLTESNRGHMEGLLQQMPALSDTLRSLGLDRAGSRVFDTPLHSDDVFQFVLARLWALAVEPVIRSLGLGVS